MSQINLGRSLALAGALVAATSLVVAKAQAQPFVAPPETREVPAPAGGTTTPAQAVSMRAGPGTDNPVIGTLHPGMPLQILASANHGWTQVQSPVGTGWVYGSYLASGTGAPEPSNVSAPMPIYRNNQPTYGNNQPTVGNSQPINSHNGPAPEISSP
jgi:uncharacterized protein YraI